MNVQEIECIGQSTHSENEINSKVEGVLKDKQQNPNDFIIVTRIPENTYKFQWIIRQFSMLPANKALYSSCIHSLETFHYLKLIKYENGFGLFHVDQSSFQPKETTSYGFASVGRVTENYTPRKPPNEFRVMLNYQVSATDCRGTELTNWSIRFSDNSEKEDLKIGEYMNSSSGHFADDSLVLNCNLKVISIPTTEEIRIASRPPLKSNGWKKLSLDLKALQENSLDSDIILIVGTDKIRAHKSILTARSAIFKKIFQHDMEEAEKNSVVITDVEYPALNKLVEYLYTGVIQDGDITNMSLQEIYDLYYAADKYEVMDLREMVGNTLMGKIQVDNAIKIFVWADLHNDSDLKSKIMSFIRLNFEVVSDTDAWNSCALQQPRLVVEIINFCAKKLKTSAP